jgi:hypothetical protein
MAIASFKNRYSVVGLAELFLREYTCCFSLYVLYVRYTHRLVLLHVSVLALQKQKSVALTFRFLWETNHHLGPCGGWWGVSPHALLDETTGEEVADRDFLQYLKVLFRQGNPLPCSCSFRGSLHEFPSLQAVQCRGHSWLSILSVWKWS